MKFLDADNISGSINKFPSQILEGYTTKLDFRPYKLPKNPNYILCGMGGSSFIIDFLHDFLDSSLHIYTSRSYNLPKETNERSLVVVSSFSGNTEETLSCYKEARKRKLPLIAMANGGKLREWALRDKVPFVRISGEGISQPRYSTGFQLGYHLSILEAHRMIPSQAKTLEVACKEAQTFNFEKEGKQLARKIHGSVIMFYTDADHASLTRIATIKVAENAKMLAHSNVVPELNHNEMNGSVFSRKQGKFSVLMLLAEDAHPRNKKRFEILTKLYRKNGISVYHFEMQGRTKLARMISAYEYTDWVSFYLSQMNNIDPSPVKMVEEFKKLIG